MEQCCQSIVGELMFSTPSTCCSDTRTQHVITQQPFESSCDGLGIIRRIKNDAGELIDNRLGRPSALTRDNRHRARRGLKENNAESLLLKTHPPFSAKHGENIGRCQQRRDLRIVDPAEEAHRTTKPSRSPFETSTISTRSGDRDLERGHTLDQQRSCLEKCVEPLAGYESAEPDDERRSRIEAHPKANLISFGGFEG